ncbi:Extracellular protease [Acropora cervicornis]|uniref:Extracellular protease n=1 Tax=Acropora cervicornis TaxID=6130 RepID=A0AAD9QDF2_ACRCE|nr:Extracellular protease [Acropora cervicornis]
MTVLWILLILGMTYGEEQMEFDRSDNTILAASIECPPTYTFKATIECRFHLKNSGKQDYSVLKWSTPLENPISDCLTVTRNGKKLEFDGIYRKRSVPGPDQFLTVKAGKTLSSMFQVSDAFDMTKAGEYSVAVDTYLEYVVGSATSKPDIKGKIRHLSSPAVSFQIVGKSSSKRTLGQKARFLESRKQSKQSGIFNGSFDSGVSRKSTSPLAPVINGGTKILQSQTKTAHDEAYNRMTTFVAAPQAKKELVKTWFGVNQVNNAATKFQSMVGVLKSETITYTFDGPHCDRNTLAYTYKQSREIFLCQLYKVASTLERSDNKMGILTHELSHAIISTDDIVYGQNACIELAKNAPNDAINNADNFEYFLEAF